jgi:hypothetical protein
MIEHLGFWTPRVLPRPCLLALVALAALAASARADDAGQPPFDFSDAFYRARAVFL